MSPVRIQRRRTKGWRMPEGAVYVGRPTRWGNPWSMSSDKWSRSGATTAAQMYRRRTEAQLARGEIDLSPLRGHDLVCWCPLDQPCHADVLLELANR
jgi:hypothetical protein